MAKKNFSNKLHDAVENYYHYNPDTLMPLMMVALATNGKLKIAAGTSIPENAACLQGSMSLRPANAQLFLNLFPGCENIKLD